MRDTKQNVCAEILSVLQEYKTPCSPGVIRAVLKDRHEWAIGLPTINKFLSELQEQGKVINMGKVLINGAMIQVFTGAKHDNTEDQPHIGQGQLDGLTRHGRAAICVA